MRDKVVFYSRSGNVLGIVRLTVRTADRLFPAARTIAERRGYFVAEFAYYAHAERSGRVLYY